jgi:hypothetical protein
MSLLTFEPETTGTWTTEWRERLKREGIDWHMLRYHKRPTLPATLFDIAAGAWRASRIVRRERIDLLHARSHVGAAIGALAKKLTGARLIFDIRGFLPEEYVDSGNWPKDGVLFAYEAAERWLYRSADALSCSPARETLFPTAWRAGRSRPCCVSAGASPTSDRDTVRRTSASDRVVCVYIRPQRLLPSTRRPRLTSRDTTAAHTRSS